jgi:hypothetical protein
MSLDVYNEQAKFKDILLLLPATLQLQFQLANTLARAHKIFVGLNLLTITPQKERYLDSVLKKLNAQIDSIESQAVPSKYLVLRIHARSLFSHQQVTLFISRWRGKKSMQCISLNRRIT